MCGGRSRPVATSARCGAIGVVRGRPTGVAPGGAELRVTVWLRGLDGAGLGGGYIPWVLVVGGLGKGWIGGGVVVRMLRCGDGGEAVG